MSRLHFRHACAAAGREAKSMHRCKPASPAPIPQNECNVTPPVNHKNQKYFVRKCIDLVSNESEPEYQSNKQQHTD